MKIAYKLFVLLFPLCILSSCQEDKYDESQAIGLWKQVSVTEDGTVMSLSAEQASCQLLIEENGSCRYFHETFKSYKSGNGPTSFYGTWSVLDGKWLNLSTDKWQFIPVLTTDSNKVTLSYKTGINEIDTLLTVQKQWKKYHIQSRFTILQLNDSEMEIRLKTFVGEKKYAMIFAPAPSDFLELKTVATGKDIYSPILVTDNNYWSIRKEFQTLKTYVFKFKKVSY